MRPRSWSRKPSTNGDHKSTSRVDVANVFQRRPEAGEWPALAPAVCHSFPARGNVPGLAAAARSPAGISAGWRTNGLIGCDALCGRAELSPSCWQQA